MADVNLVATKDFSYSTRRLKAGDEFTVPERMARVLVGINKAEHVRAIGRVSKPSQELMTKAVEVAPVKTEETSRPKRRRRTTKKA